MKMWTIEEIKEVLQSNDHHYFDKDTLKAFGQKLSDFNVGCIDGRIFVYAKTHSGWDFPAPYPNGIYSLAEFFPEKKGTRQPKDSRAIARLLA